MNCSEIHKLFQIALDGTIPETQENEFHSHLSCCSGCFADFVYLKQLNEYIDVQKVQKAPSWLSNSILQKVVTVETKSKLIFPQKWMRVAAILVIALGIFGGIAAGNKLYTIDDYEYQAWVDEFVLEAEVNDAFLDNLFSNTN